MRNLFLILIWFLTTQTFAQVYTTTGTGNTNWTNVSAWLADGNPAVTFPTAANSSSITISRSLTISSNLTIDQATIAVGGVITISGGTTLTIADDGTAASDLILQATSANPMVVTGTLVVEANATYEHARNGGSIPLATWNSNSTCLVTGITSTSPTLNPLNAYQHFIWNCNQSSGESLAGDLQTINGNLQILNTNNQLLSLGTNTVYTLNINGNFIVSGNARVRLTSSAASTINVSGNFSYTSSAASASSFKTTGAYVFNVNGNFQQDAGTITVSDGNGVGTINIAGDFIQNGGTLNEISNGSGLIVLNGTTQQEITQNGTITSTNAIDLAISNPAGVIFNSNVSIPRNFTQLPAAGTVDLNGNILTIGGNLSQSSGSLAVNASAQVILQGTGTLPGVGFPITFSGTQLGRLTLNQSGTFETNSNLSIQNLDLFNGTLNSTSISMATGGTIERRAGTISATPGGASYNLVYNLTTATNTGPEMPTSATVLNNLTKVTGTATLTLNQALVTVNGNLTLSNGTFALGPNSVTLGGNFISNSAMTTLAGSVFTFTSPSAGLSGSITPAFRNLAVLGSLTPAVNYNVSGNFTIGPGAVVNAGSNLVTFNGTTSVLNSGTINLNNVTIAAGSSLTAPANTLSIAGTFTINGTSTFVSNNGTIQFNGSATLAGTGTKTFNNIIVTNGSSLTGTVSWGFNGTLTNNGTVTFNSATSVCTINGAATLVGSGATTVGDLTINAGASLTTAHSFNVVDDFTINGTFNATAGTVQFIAAGGGIAGAGLKNFYDVTVPVGGALTYTVIVNVARDLTINGTLAEGSGTTVFNGTTSTIQGTGTLAFNFLTVNAGATVNAPVSFGLDDDLTVNGTFNSTGTITATGPVILAGSGSATLSGLTVTTGNSFTPNMDYSIIGNINVIGTLAAGTATTTCSGNTTISGGGSVNFNFLTITGTLTSSSGVVSIVRDFNNQGTFNHNGGTISFSTTGTVQQQILGTNSVIFNNLTANNVTGGTDLINNVTAPATTSIRGTLTLGEINTVVDADGSGTSQLILLSTNDSPAADARIAPLLTGSSISGSFTVQRYASNETTGRFYRNISSPVVGATVLQLKNSIPVTGIFLDPSDALSTPPCNNGCITGNPSVYFWDEVGAAYVPFPGTGVASGSATFVSGRGYATFFRHAGGGVGNVTVNFRGIHPPQTGVSLPVSPTANGYSLVGNPYPSAIVWNNGAGWTKTNVADGIVVRDFATGIHQAYSAAAGTGIIASGQSFWVQSSAAGAALTINESAKTGAATSFYRVDAPSIDAVNLQLTKSSTGTTDITTISRRAGSLTGLDQFDVFKFDNNLDDGITITQVHDLAVMAGTSTLLVSTVPALTCQEVFKLRINDVLNGGEQTASYTLDLQRMGAFAGLEWVLMDSQTGTEHYLSEGAYSFTVNITDGTVTTFGNNRYRTNRFSIKALKQEINTNLPMATTEHICTGSQAVLSVSNSQPGLMYAAEINGQLQSITEQGTGGLMNLFIPSELLQPGTNTLRVKADAGCDSKFLTASATITLLEAPTITQVVPATLCAPGMASVEATSSVGSTINWYASATETIPLFTGTNFTTPFLITTQTYYTAASNAAGCESERVPVEVTLLDLSTPVEIKKSIEKVCAGMAVTLTASSSLPEGTFRWYEQPEGASWIQEGESFTTPPLSKSGNFYVAFKMHSGCEGPRLLVSVPVEAFSPSIVVKALADEVCVGATHTLLASGAPAGTVYTWYDAATAHAPIHSGEEFITPALQETKSYYVAATSEMGCEALDRYEVQAIVRTPPATNFSYQATKVCSGSMITVDLTSQNSAITSYRWYETIGSVTPIHEGKTWSGQWATTTEYLVSAVDGHGCESNDRQAVIIPIVDFVDPVIEHPEAGLLKIANTTGPVQWFLNDLPLAGETKTDLLIEEPGVYSVEITTQGCTAWASRYVGEQLITGLAQEQDPEVSIFPNPTSELLTVRVATQGPVAAALIDVNGRPVGEFLFVDSGSKKVAQLDVSQLHLGLYFVRVVNSGRVLSKQILIVR